MLKFYGRPHQGTPRAKLAKPTFGNFAPQADIPEAETLFGHGSFDFLKLASSAAHVTNRTYTSSESFINVRAPHIGTKLTMEELQLLAGRQYSAGINRLVFHGVPYPYTRSDGKEW